MIIPRSNPKIRPDHLERKAFVYVRQSTLFQVREHTASTARQYDLTHRAEELGWSKAAVTVIDQDQGRSGSSAADRDGFQFLIAQVGLGQAGAVISLEASRLARACSDWYRLLEICALTDTLVIDEDGVYDPGQYADRLLLGVLGSMSEAELHWLRNRLLGGKLARAEKGELRMRPPVGLVFDAARRLVLDPDEQVRHAVQLLFTVFERSGSARAVVKHFAEHRLLFPDRLWGKTRDGELLWKPLRHGRLLDVLHNPRYAGAYVYGRTRTRTRALPGESPRVKGRTCRVAPADWPIVRRDAHPAYITWDQFLRNQQRLGDNCTNRATDRRGAVREGNALLQGLVLCGRCGRRMSVRYARDRRTPSYECTQVHKQQGGRTCQFVRGDGVDAAVSRLFLEAIRPAQLDVSLAALEEIESRTRQVEQQWELRQERARYEADLARRRFLAVDPENRLVARTLEKDWNEKLAAAEQLEREQAVAAVTLAPPLSPEERQRILALEDLPALWHAPTTTPAERKQLLRLLIKDVTLTKGAATITAAVRWQTGVCTTVEVPRPPRSCDAKRTPAAVVDHVRTLAADHTDRQIAERLNTDGCKSGGGGIFTASKVQWIRYAHRIGRGRPNGSTHEQGEREDGRCSARAAATALNVTVSTIAEWCKNGLLDGMQATARGAWWVRLTPEITAQLRKPVRHRWTRQSPG